MAETATVLDVTTPTFEKEVIERSRTTPVLVDFWATWCGPCRTLSPVLEKLAREGAGSFVLAKVDIDGSPELAEAFGVQSVPTVALLKDGRIVDGFLGAQPEAKIRALLAKHVTTVKDSVVEALELERAGKIGEAISVLRDRAKAERSDWKARAQLARMLALSGALGEAQLLIDALPEDERVSEAARGALAILGAQDHAGDLAALERAAAANPDDVLARLKLGRALLAAREVEKGVSVLFEAARRDVGFQGGEPRKAMLEAFAALGEEHPMTKEFRRKLSVLLCG